MENQELTGCQLFPIDPITLLTLRKFSNLAFELLNEPKVTIMDVIDKATEGAPKTSLFLLKMFKKKFAQDLESTLDQACDLLKTSRSDFRSKFGTYKSWYDLRQDEKNFPGLEDQVLLPSMTLLKGVLSLVIKGKWGGCDQEKVLQIVGSLTESLKNTRLASNNKPKIKG